MKMWICRDEDGLLHLEFTDKPPFKSIYERTVVWASNSEWGSVELDRTSYPEVTFKNSPMEVELVPRGFTQLVRRMREAQKREWETKSKQTCGKELDEHTEVVTKLESEVDEYLKKMEE